MHDDAPALIDAVRHTVGPDPPGGHAVHARRRFATTVDDLWDALTAPDRIARWLLPVAGDLRPGGRYQLEGNAGGEILECEGPSSLVVTWEFGGESSRLALTLAPEDDDGAALDLAHTDIADGDHWAQFGPGAVGVGWDLSLLGLERHIATAGAGTPDEGLDWLMSDAGRAFVGASAEAWGRAALGGGHDPDVARAAAARTRAAYGAP